MYDSHPQDAEQELQERGAKVIFGHHPETAGGGGVWLRPPTTAQADAGIRQIMAVPLRNSNKIFVGFAVNHLMSYFHR